MYIYTLPYRAEYVCKFEDSSKYVQETV